MTGRRRPARSTLAVALTLAALVWATLGASALNTHAANASFVAPSWQMQIGSPGPAFVYPFGMAWDPTTGTNGSLLVDDYNNYNVKRFTGGAYTTSYGSKGRASGQFAEQPSEIAVNPTDGSFVVAFAFNGYGYMKFDKTGKFLFQVAIPAAWYAPFIAVNASGEVYLVQSTGLAKTSPNIVLMYDASGNPLGQFGTNGTNCSKGQFGLIRGVDVDSAGNVYVNDVANHCVQVFDPSGTFEGYFGSKTQLSANTRGMKLDRAHNVVYVADAAKEDVVAYNFTLNPLTHAFQPGSGTYAGTIGTPGITVGSSCGGNGELDAPRDIAVGPDHTVYVSDYACWIVDTFNPLFASTNPGQPTGQLPTPSQPPLAGGLHMANGVAVSGDGSTVYVADTFNQRIQEFNGPNPSNGATPGSFAQQWGSRLPNLAGPLSMDYPRGVGVDPADPTGSTVWVSDTRSGYVKQYVTTNSTTPPPTVNAGTIFTGGGMTEPLPIFYSDGITVAQAPPGDLFTGPEALYIPDSGYAYFAVTDTLGNLLGYFPCGTLVEPAVFNGCPSAAVDSNGVIYAASYNEGLVQVFTPNNMFPPVYTQSTTPIGTTAPGGKLSGPYGVALYGTTLYVTQSGKNEVSAFNITDGSYLGSWGVKGSGHGQFNRPLGIAVDNAGLIYVSDYGNGRIEVYHP